VNNFHMVAVTQCQAGKNSTPAKNVGGRPNVGDATAKEMETGSRRVLWKLVIVDRQLIVNG